MTLQKIIKQINQFTEDRNWGQFHNEKDLALSISIEAAELLEDFQWLSSEEAIEKNLENIKEEIADVLIYTLMLTDNLGLDVPTIIEEKIAKNAIKYPLDSK